MNRKLTFWAIMCFCVQLSVFTRFEATDNFRTAFSFAWKGLWINYSNPTKRSRYQALTGSYSLRNIPDKYPYQVTYQRINDWMLNQNSTVWKTIWIYSKEKRQAVACFSLMFRHQTELPLMASWRLFWRMNNFVFGVFFPSLFLQVIALLFRVFDSVSFC